jgi:hypothetical protein
LCPPPSAGEAAIQHLLEAVRAQQKMAHNLPPAAPKALTFLSGGQPRDRRGRIQAQKPRRLNSLSITAAARGWRGGVGDFGSFDEEDFDFDDGEGGGERTPRVLRREDRSAEYFDIDRDQEREFLNSLRCVFVFYLLRFFAMSPNVRLY